jgi:NADH:ubiquinone reductase (H+-translocating)
MATTPSAKPSSEELAAAPHVVVVGAGFAGLAVVRRLADGPVRVTIVDRHNFHTFTPLLYQVATAGLEPADVAYPVRTIFGHASNVQVRHATVRGIDQTRGVVVLNDDAEIEYDHLVVATGGVATYFNIPGAQENSLPLYTLADARRLRNRVLHTLEDADLAAETSSPEVNFVVVGGGPTGVETAGALSELIDITIKRDGLRLDPARVRITLVDLASRLLTAFPQAASTYSQRTLTHLGVDVELSRSVVDVGPHSIRFDDGASLEAAAVVWAGGITAAGTLTDTLNGAHGPSGRALVGADLRLVGTANVWCVGDAAAIPSGVDTYYPQLAPVAIQSGHHCASQILRVINGAPTEPFHYHNKGIMATIGRRAAVAKLPYVPVITGTAGWFAWLGLHLWYLIGFRNRLRVLINWTWRYFDWPSGPRLIVADAETAE